MSPEAQRLAIAKEVNDSCAWQLDAQGWRRCPLAFDLDLNAIHSAAMRLKGKRLERYRHELIAAYGLPAAIDATAEERARAFLIACHRWRGEVVPAEPLDVILGKTAATPNGKPL